MAAAYRAGIGTLKDFKKSFSWLTKSAKQGYAPAQTALGYAYAAGEIGLLKDMNKAKFWIEKGHKNGDQKAKEYWDKFELWKY